MTAEQPGSDQLAAKSFVICCRLNNEKFANGGLTCKQPVESQGYAPLRRNLQGGRCFG